MLGMGAESGIVDVDYLGVLRKRLRQSQRVLIVPRHSNVEGANAAQEEPRVDRSKNGTDGEVGAPDFLDQVITTRDDTSRNIRVTSQILRRAMPDEICSQGDRTLIDGRGHRVVNRDQRTVVMRNVGEALDVGQLKKGIDRKSTRL